MSIIVILGMVLPANSAARQSPSPVKAFQDLPDGYANIIAGCIGRDAWYTNQWEPGRGTHAELTIVANSVNCAPGGALRP